MTRWRSASLLVGGLRLLKRGAEDVTQRGAGVGRAVLRHRLLLLGDLEGLDRQRHAARLAVELRHAGVDSLAGGKALGPLVAAVAGELGAADEGRQVGVDDLHLETGVLHLEDLAGDDLALADL